MLVRANEGSAVYLFLAQDVKIKPNSVQKYLPILT